jgi:hypothetical protein
MIGKEPPSDMPVFQSDWAFDPEIDSSKVIRFKATPAAEPRCSFCGNPKSKVVQKMLIRSKVNDHHICISCLIICNHRLEENS